MENNELKISPNKGLVSDVLQSPKIMMTNQTRPPSSYGIKLSANMTSQAKQDLLNKLEEWRRAKRQNLAKTMPDKLKPSTPVNKAPINSSINKSCIPNSENVLPSQANPSRESVFERLYRNEKQQKKSEKFVSGNSGLHINKNDISSIKHVDVFSSDEEYYFEGKSDVYEMDNKAVSIETAGVMADPTNHFEETEKTEKKTNTADMPIIINNECGPAESESIEKKITESDVSSKVEKDVFESINLDACDKKQSQIDNIAPEVVKKSQLNQSKQEANRVSKKEPNTIVPMEKDEHSFHAHKAKVNEPNKLMTQNKPTEKPRPTIRRSISMLYRQKKGLLRTASEKNLRELKTLPQKKEAHPRPVPKFLAKKNKLLMKPTAAVLAKGKKVSTTTSLRNKLEDWLKLNKHSLDGYRHLRCFGITKDPVKANGSVSNKPWQVTDAQLSEPTHEDENKENALPTSPAQTKQFEPGIEDCKNWLNELYRLIVDVKYPLERCEEWLTAIRNKCPMSTQLPIYWECLTALNGDGKPSEGKENDLCNENKMEPSEEALAEIFDKMIIENQKPSKLEKGLDPDNIFKSTVIKFAVTETPSKSSTKSTKGMGTRSGLETVHTGQLVATPVRRSTRNAKILSKGIVDSLRGLTPDPLNQVTFKANASLLDRL